VCTKAGRRKKGSDHELPKVEKSEREEGGQGDVGKGRRGSSGGGRKKSKTMASEVVRRMFALVVKGKTGVGPNKSIMTRSGKGS